MPRKIYISDDPVIAEEQRLYRNSEAQRRRTWRARKKEQQEQVQLEADVSVFTTTGLPIREGSCSSTGPAVSLRPQPSSSVCDIADVENRHERHAASTAHPNRITSEAGLLQNLIHSSTLDQSVPRNLYFKETYDLALTDTVQYDDINENMDEDDNGRRPTKPQPSGTNGAGQPEVELTRSSSTVQEFTTSIIESSSPLTHLEERYLRDSNGNITPEKVILRGPNLLASRMLDERNSPKKIIATIPVQIKQVSLLDKAIVQLEADFVKTTQFSVLPGASEPQRLSRKGLPIEVEGSLMLKRSVSAMQEGDEAITPPLLHEDHELQPVRGEFYSPKRIARHSEVPETPQILSGHDTDEELELAESAKSITQAGYRETQYPNSPTPLWPRMSRGLDIEPLSSLKKGMAKYIDETGYPESEYSDPQIPTRPRTAKAVDIEPPSFSMTDEVDTTEAEEETDLQDDNYSDLCFEDQARATTPEEDDEYESYVREARDYTSDENVDAVDLNGVDILKDIAEDGTPVAEDDYEYLSGNPSGDEPGGSLEDDWTENSDPESDEERSDDLSINNLNNQGRPWTSINTEDDCDFNDGAELLAAIFTKILCPCENENPPRKAPSVALKEFNSIRSRVEQHPEQNWQECFSPEAPLAIDFEQDRPSPEEIKTYETTYDIDAILFVITSLAAHKRSFRMSLYPKRQYRMTHDTYVRLDRSNKIPHHKQKNMRFGYGMQATHLMTMIFFPNMPCSAKGETHPDDDQHSFWLDKILLPALIDVLPASILARIPKTSKAIISNAKSLQKESPTANGVQQLEAFHIVDEQYLEAIWARVCETVDQNCRREPRRRDSSEPCYHDFKGLYLLVSEYGCKGHLHDADLTELCERFERGPMSSFDMDFVNLDTFWVDIAQEIICSKTPDGSNATLVPRLACLHHLYTEMGMGSREEFRWHLSHDAGTMRARVRIRSFLRALGIAFRQDYAGVKETLYNMNRGHVAFGDPLFEAIGVTAAQSEQWYPLKQAGSSAEARRARLLRNYEACQERVRNSFETGKRTSFGKRTEIRVRYPLLRKVAKLLEEMSHEACDNTGHVPFYRFNSDDVFEYQRLVLDRYISGIDHCARRYNSAPGRSAVFDLEEQIVRSSVTSTFLRVLATFLSSGPAARQSALWKGKYKESKKTGQDSKGTILRGLDLQSAAKEFNHPWLPASFFNYENSTMLVDGPIKCPFRHNAYRTHFRHSKSFGKLFWPDIEDRLIANKKDKLRDVYKTTNIEEHDVENRYRYLRTPIMEHLLFALHRNYACALLKSHKGEFVLDNLTADDREGYNSAYLGLLHKAGKPDACRAHDSPVEPYPIERYIWFTRSSMGNSGLASSWLLRIMNLFGTTAPGPDSRSTRGSYVFQPKWENKSFRVLYRKALRMIREIDPALADYCDSVSWAVELSNRITLMPMYDNQKFRNAHRMCPIHPAHDSSDSRCENTLRSKWLVGINASIPVTGASTFRNLALKYKLVKKNEEAVLMVDPTTSSLPSRYGIKSGPLVTSEEVKEFKDYIKTFGGDLSRYIK